MAIRYRNDKHLKLVLQRLLDVVPACDQVLILDSSGDPFHKESSRIEVIRLPNENYDDRFYKKLISIDYAIHDKILFLDADQVPESGLLEELDKLHSDSVIIPERSWNRNFIGLMLDRKRSALESLAVLNSPSPDILVIPRLYRKDLLKKAICRISREVCVTSTAHEDSILYLEYFRESSDVGFSKRFIFNIDPGTLEFLKKSYRVGKYNGMALQSKVFPLEYKRFITKLNLRSANLNKKLLLNGGIFIDALKLVPTVLGFVAGRRLADLTENLVLAREGQH